MEDKQPRQWMRLVRTPFPLLGRGGWAVFLLTTGSLLALLLMLTTLLLTPREAAGTASGNATGSPFVGKLAPDFTFSTWNLTPPYLVHLAAFKGRPVVVNFWASWCEACKREAKAFEATWQTYRPHGVVFLGVAFGDTEAEGTKFLRIYGITYLSGPDERGSIGIDYGVTAVPETVFIDHRGSVRSKYIGEMTEAQLSQAIGALLASPYQGTFLPH